MDTETPELPPDQPTYRRLVAAWPFGKRLPEAVYLHVTLVAALPDELQHVVRRAVELAQVEHDAFNVVKLAVTVPKVSLLAYPEFFTAPFPTLHVAWTV